MARVPLIQEQDHPELAEVIQKYAAGRRGKLLNLYRMLLNAPALAESWFNHSNAIRWKTTLDGRLREIVIIRMGHLAGCGYVLRQHVPALALADGLTVEECNALADWRASKLFSERERAALAYADIDDARDQGAGPGVRRSQKALRRPRHRRADGADRHLQHECARARGARTRPRTSCILTGAGQCQSANPRCWWSKTTASCASSASCSIPARRKSVSTPMRISSPTTSAISPAVAGACAQRARGALPGGGTAGRGTGSNCARKHLPDAHALIVESLARRARGARSAANLRLVQKYGTRTAQHQSRRMRGAQHQGAHHPPPRQHRLRRDDASR